MEYIGSDDIKLPNVTFWQCHHHVGPKQWPSPRHTIPPEKHNKHQLIDQLTRITSTSRTLQYPIITKNLNLINNSGVISPFCSDHHGTFVELDFQIHSWKVFSREIWNYDEGSYTAIKRALNNTNWDILTSNNVEESTANITDHILHKCKEFIPHRTILVRQSDPAWITTDIKRMIRKRKRHHAVAKQTNNLNHWTRFRATRNEVIEEIRNSKKNFLIKTALRLRDGNITPKQWWSLVKSHTKNQSGTHQIPIIIDEDRK